MGKTTIVHSKSIISILSLSKYSKMSGGFHPLTTTAKTPVSWLNVTPNLRQPLNKNAFEVSDNS